MKVHHQTIKETYHGYRYCGINGYDLSGLDTAIFIANDKEKIVK
jgi:hypothetical protein